MQRAATIARIQPGSGSSTQIWSTTSAGDKRHQELLVHAIGLHKIKHPGLYLVCTINPGGIPIGTVFTVSKSMNMFKVETGARLSERVNRWPPANLDL